MELRSVAIILHAVLIVTTKNSNMMEDLQTLELLAKCIPQQVAAEHITEASVRESVFEVRQFRPV